MNCCHVTEGLHLCPMSVGEYTEIQICALVFMVLDITARGCCILATDISWFCSRAGKAEESWCLTECSCYSDYSV